MVSKVLVDMAKMTDVAIARFVHSFFPEKHALIVLNFHAVVRDFDELRENVICPQFCLTLEQVRGCIEYFLGHGYIPVSPDESVLGLRDDRSYVMFTFDDGYFNNSQVIPLLVAAGVPALFAIITDYVSSGKSFWWDVVYRERAKREVVRLEAIEAEINWLMPQSPQVIEQYLISEFGEESLEPIGDIDRPFSPAELRVLASNKYVFLANHTAAHDWLPNCSISDLKATFGRAQDYLEEVTGTRPVAAVYPFGNASEQVIQVAKDVGLELGFTTRLAKQPLPIEPANEGCMRLPRFAMRGIDPILQCEKARFDWRLSGQLKRGFHSLLNHQTAA
jgi:peptidoglycan/xylan/chitin deacetylase (PgdA/CDA1 family)